MRLSHAPRERMNLTNTVAGEIRAEMARQRITQRGMARRLDVVEAWLSRRLNGHISLNLDELDRIAGVLGISVLELIRRASEARREPTSGVAAVHVVAPYRTARGVPSGVRRPVRLCAARSLAA